MKRFGVGAVVALFFWLAFARDAQAAVDTHTIYLNNCQPDGCVVTRGSPSNATTDKSDIVQGTLTAFSQSATIWASAVSCFKTVMSPFNVTITETRPTSGDYFEVMVAGLPTDVGESSDQGGNADALCITPGNCSGPYLPDALVFVYANASFYTNNPNTICATVAEELGATWTLDHVVDFTDVMSYNEEDAGIRAFHDGEACGSDCSGGVSPFGLTCTGSGGNATHTCMGSNAATQDEVKTILALFGPAPLPPTVAITSPPENAVVSAGFPIDATCTSLDGVKSVAIAIDNGAATTLTTAPYTTTAPATISAGAHTITATCTTTPGLVATATTHVTINASASSDAGPSVDAGNTSDAGDTNSGSGSGDSGGCNVERSSRVPISFAGLAFVIAAFAIRRSKRSRARRSA